MATATIRRCKADARRWLSGGPLEVGTVVEVIRDIPPLPWVSIRHEAVGEVLIEREYLRFPEPAPRPKGRARKKGGDHA